MHKMKEKLIFSKKDLKVFGEFAQAHERTQIINRLEKFNTPSKDLNSLIKELKKEQERYLNKGRRKIK